MYIHVYRSVCVYSVYYKLLLYIYAMRKYITSWLLSYRVRVDILYIFCYYYLLYIVVSNSTLCHTRGSTEQKNGQSAVAVAISAFF